MLLLQLAGATVPQGLAEALAPFALFSTLRVEPAAHVMLQQVSGAGVVVTVVAGVVVTVVAGVVVTVVAGVVVTVVAGVVVTVVAGVVVTVVWMSQHCF
jgi:hypothetical protein